MEPNDSGEQYQPRLLTPERSLWYKKENEKSSGLYPDVGFLLSIPVITRLHFLISKWAIQTTIGATPTEFNP